MDIQSRPYPCFLSAACGIAILSLAPSLSAAPPRVFLLDANALSKNRESLRTGDTRLTPALEKLKRQANAALKAGPYSVVHKKLTPPSGDKHDYMSYAPYWWPDPAKPDGPYIRRDGHRIPDRSNVSDHAELDSMTTSVETLALTYYFTGDEKFADRARFLIRAWFIDPATRMNPSFQFAQAVRGRDTGRGMGLIDCHCLTQLIDSVGLIADSKAWTPDDDRAIRAWFGDFLHWMRDTEMGRDEASQKNNHGTYYDVQVADYALFLDQPELARKVLETARTKRITLQVEPDGRQPLELARTNSWGYSLANLRGLMLLATLGERAGVDLWGYKTDDGRSICAAIEYLAPFGLNQEPWTHEQLDGFNPEAVHPLLRAAAKHYPDASFCDSIKTIPLETTDRAILLSN